MRQKGSNLHEPFEISRQYGFRNRRLITSIRSFTAHKVNLNAEKLDEKLYGKINGVYLL